MQAFYIEARAARQLRPNPAACICYSYFHGRQTATVEYTVADRQLPVAHLPRPEPRRRDATIVLA